MGKNKLGSQGKKRSLLGENLSQAGRIMRIHRMRSFLLILGVAIGITTILGMVTVLSGLGKKINKDLVAANRPYLIVQKFDMFVGGVNEEELLRRKDLKPEDAAALRSSCPALDKVCYSISPNRSFILYYKANRTKPIQVLGASSSMPRIYSLKLGGGRFYSQVEEAHRERVVVLGFGPAKDLFPHENPIGKFVRIHDKRYKVVGTFARRKHFIGSLSDNFAVIPHTSYRKDFQGRFDSAGISANVREGHTLEEAATQIVNVLRIRRKVPPGKENDFAVITSEAFIKTIGKVTFYIGVVLTIIASIGLIVGGIGVMNMMLISVAERTREIGLRMAMGARKQDILQQFLIESATLTGIGGIAGTILGIVFAIGVSRLINFPFYFSIPWTLISVIFSVLVGIVFGLYPARRASKLDPVEALRYE